VKREWRNVKHIFSPSLSPSPQGREEKNVLGSRLKTLGKVNGEWRNVKHIFSPSLSPSPQGREEKNVQSSKFNV